MKEQSAQNEPIAVKNAPFEKPRTLIEWQSPLRLFEKKGKNYLVVLLGTTGVLMLFLVLLHQWVLAFLVGTVAFVLYAFSTVEPSQGSYQILTTGIKLADKLYYFRDLRHFWIEQKKEQKILQVTT